MTEQSQDRIVFCQKFQKKLPGLTQPPLPGELGMRIFEHISYQAWQEWRTEQTKIINELKLKVFEKSAQDTLQQHLQKFLFENAKTIFDDKANS
ncbi:MAG: oxidative damage protection protein [Bdellovibrionales bacterium]|nr:oxidative damage protection protein [Bdellovibrionales bacterium]